MTEEGKLKCVSDLAVIRFHMTRLKKEIKDLVTSPDRMRRIAELEADINDELLNLIDQVFLKD